MNREERSVKILERLSASDVPVSATTLANELGVSRQVIVQDVALLRAAGTEIQPLARGYVLPQKNVHHRTFKLIHSDDEVEAELNLIVDRGGTVEDVFVFHRTYGIIRGKMGIQTRMDVQQFLKDLSSGKSDLLKNVTFGYHYHTVSAKDSATLDLIEQALQEAGFIAPLQEYEPDEVLK